MYQPDEFEKKQFSELHAKYELMKLKHRRLNCSPSKFVEAYEDFQEACHSFEGLAWPEIEQTVSRLKSFAETLRPAYERWLPGAKEQKERNELWEKLYKPSVRFFEGGRAHGNS